MAAAAAATVSAIQGATSSYASLAGIPIVGPGLGAIAAAAALAAGFANVKKIYAVKSGLKGDSAGGGSSVSGSSFAGTTSVGSMLDGGLVGRSSSENIGNMTKKAFSEALGENPQVPVLVVDEVTAKQQDSKLLNQISIL